MPDGTIVTDVPEGTTQAEVMKRYKASQRAGLGIDKPSDVPAASKFDDKPPGQRSHVDPINKGVTDLLGGMNDVSGFMPSGKAVAAGADVGAAAVTGLGADIAGGLMGAATLATNAVGLTHDDPVEMIRQWQAKAYTPQTDLGKRVEGAIGTMGEKTIGAASKALGEHFYKATGSPMEATIAEIMPDAIATIAGFRGPEAFKEMATRGAGEIARDSFINKTKTEALKAAKNNSLSVPPADDYMGFTSRSVASASNAPEINRELSIKNRDRVVDMFKANQELPESAAVDRGTFTQLRAKWNQRYQTARTLPPMQLDAEFLADVFNAGAKFEQLTADFSPADLVDLETKIAQLRGTYIRPSWSANSAVNMMSHLRESGADLLRSENSVDRKLGFVHREMAEAFEDRLWRHARDKGSPQMATEFQEARRKLAQLHVWEDNADMDKGFFSSRGIVASRKALKARVDPFTDELQAVADVAGAYPATFQDVQIGVRPISVFERYMIIGAAAGAGFGLFEGGVAGGAEGSMVGASIAASGIAGRAAAGSQWWQKHMLKPKTGESGPVRRGAMSTGRGAQVAGAAAGAEAGNE
jgi:hypothetical protein